MVRHHHYHHRHHDHRHHHHNNNNNSNNNDNNNNKTNKLSLLLESKAMWPNHKDLENVRTVYYIYWMMIYFYFYFFFKGSNLTIVTREGNWCESEQFPDNIEKWTQSKNSMRASSHCKNRSFIRKYLYPWNPSYCQNSMSFLSSLHLVIIKIYFQKIAQAHGPFYGNNSYMVLDINYNLIFSYLKVTLNNIYAA